MRLFTFGVGNDVNTILLDTLTQEQRGASGYVQPGERIDEEVSAFYAKVSTPLLADIAIEVEGVHIEDVYPYPLPDLFAGSQLVIVGRYRQGGPAKIRLTGQVNEQEQRFIYEGFFETSGGDNFIPRLWATRKIGYLLNQIRLHGENRELVDEIVELSIRYGIVTPYTSYLVQEEVDVLTPEGRRTIAADEFNSLSAAPELYTGAEAVEEAEAKAAIQDAERAAAPTSETAEVVKVVGAKAFVYRDGAWIDTTFDPSRLTAQKIGFGSETYFDLLAARPDVGAYLALGDRVVMVVDGMAYEVTEDGEDDIIIPPTPTPRPDLIDATPQTRTDMSAEKQGTQQESKHSNPGLLCPGTVLAGLVLVPLAGAGLRRKRRK